MRGVTTLWLKTRRLAMEPPFRLLVREAVRLLPTSVQTKSDWDAVDRPHCLFGMLEGARQATRESVTQMAVVEFGVAAGRGLLTLQSYAQLIERHTGVQIELYGFDTGKGMPGGSNDHRDHPDVWKAGDYPMDEPALRARLGPRTSLILGPIDETLPLFIEAVQRVPVGFVVFDVDFYSSTRDALMLFSHGQRRMLHRVPLYFDDVDLFHNHRFAGELLAIDEFNASSEHVKIDRWRGIAAHRVFFESPWLEKMYVAHDLEAIAGTRLGGPPAHLAT